MKNIPFYHSNGFFFQFCQTFPATRVHPLRPRPGRPTVSRCRRPTRDRNSFPSISIFSPASGALMKNDSDARHYSSALSSVIGSFFPRARTHEKSNLSTTADNIVFRPPRGPVAAVPDRGALSSRRKRALPYP